ncbi:hypothetical protein THAOC_02968 [Thalassiosira oceanica]|uniref:Uncharacterized protein n=1 Tax=Thalassiosira oceanica TaxID=159749 RepID=K0TLH7_THAOC|nr:hypothetical protein THAOC_02968 [Thalassiosira oceanica]|eukprot:EJK75311.1 hypothetical protein THAOC_02968 [Thalassiosira oceanica]
MSEVQVRASARFPALLCISLSYRFRVTSLSLYEICPPLGLFAPSPFFGQSARELRPVAAEVRPAAHCSSSTASSRPAWRTAWREDRPSRTRRRGRRRRRSPSPGRAGAGAPRRDGTAPVEVGASRQRARSGALRMEGRGAEAVRHSGRGVGNKPRPPWEREYKPLPPGGARVLKVKRRPPAHPGGGGDTARDEVESRGASCRQASLPTPAGSRPPSNPGPAATRQRRQQSVKEAAAFILIPLLTRLQLTLRRRSPCGADRSLRGVQHGPRRGAGQLEVGRRRRRSLSTWGVLGRSRGGRPAHDDDAGRRGDEDGRGAPEVAGEDDASSPISTRGVTGPIVTGAGGPDGHSIAPRERVGLPDSHQGAPPVLCPPPRPSTRRRTLTGPGFSSPAAAGDNGRREQDVWVRRPSRGGDRPTATLLRRLFRLAVDGSSGGAV